MRACLVLFAAVLVSLVNFTIAQDGDAPVPRYVIDLDLPAEERWKDIGQEYSSKLSDLFENGLSELFTLKAIRMLSIESASLLPQMPQPYKDEMIGLAKHSGVPVGTIVMWNILMEISVFNLNDTHHFNPRVGCTSIVAQCPEGNIYHGRNLDLEWITESLRQLAITVDFQRKKVTQYTATTLVGLVGTWSGQRPNKYTLTLDERDKGEWWENVDRFMKLEVHYITFLMRDILADSSIDFEGAVQKLSNTPLVSPIYFIIGGVNRNEGAVITRARDKAIDVMRLNADEGRWFVLETNYDHWEQPPATDNRREPALEGLKRIGIDKVSPENLYEVLSIPPVMSNMTIFTMTMSAAHPEQYKVVIRRPVSS